MTMTLSEFRAAYPEFDAVADATVQAQLTNFDLLYQGDYGDLSDYLSGLYVSHQLTVFSVNTSAEPVQAVKSRSVDGISWSYAESSNAKNAGEFAATKYGLEFSRLMGQLGQGPVMSGAVQ